MSSGKTKPRLGKGLSGLIGTPVAVEIPPRDDKPVDNQTNTKLQSAAMSTAAPSKPASTPIPTPPSDSPRVVPPPPAPTGEVSRRSRDAAGQVAATSPSRSAPSDSPFQFIPIDRIVPNRFQPRQTTDREALDRLANSIRAAGVMQPIAVRPVAPKPGSSGGVSGGASYELIAGERRWRAAEIAGLKTIPAIVTQLDDRAAAEWAIVENVQREDLNPIDRAWAFRRLIERFNLSHGQIAERVGVERSSVANFVRLTELEKEIQELIANGRLTLGHAKALLGAPAGAMRIDGATLAADSAWSVRQIEDWATRANAMANAGIDSPEYEKIKKIARPRAATLDALEKQLAEHLGTKVRLRANNAGTRGKLTLDFYSVEHFDGLMAKMGFEMRS